MIHFLLWKRNVGWLAGIATFPLVWFLLGDTIRGEGQLYRVDLTSKATAATFISLTLVAALSAWEGVRVTPTIRNTAGVHRQVLTVALMACLPAILSTCLAYVLAAAVRFIAEDVPLPLPTFTIFLGIVVLHIAVALVGVAVGSVSSNYLAAPVAGVLIYGLFIILGIASQGRLRLLFGQQYDCCALNQSPSDVAVAIPFVTAAGVGALMVAVLAWRWRRQHRLSVVTSILSVALLWWSVWAALAAGQSGPLVARTGNMVCETSVTSGIEYCVWPEHDDLLEQLLTTGDRAFANWDASTRLGLPHLVTEQLVDNASSEIVPISMGPQPEDEDVIAAIAWGLTPEIPDCVMGWRNYLAHTQLMAWLLLTAGVDPEHQYMLELRAMTPPTEEDPVAVAERLMGSSPDEQQAWLDEARAAFGTCDASFSVTTTQQ